MSVIQAPPAPTHDLGGTRFTSLATPTRGSNETAVWQVEIEPGTPPTPHSMTREEVFVVLAGRATVRIGEGTSVADVGDAIVIPTDTEFELSNVDTTVLRLLCCSPVGAMAQLGDDQPFTPPWAE
ncbi:MAG TPA: cupin domain-containing protein [Ilumatobacteraceae bacterium]|jgi:quercetin dioxygenase-like cupin family protein|nr:cupin domain-containing protein [Ilumatobacteraceae bacterium]